MCRVELQIMVSLKNARREKWKVLAGCTGIFLLLTLSYIYAAFFTSFSYKTSGIYNLALTSQELHKTANGLGPKEDLPWWETDDCQCKAEACTKPSVTFKSLLMDEVGGTCGRRSWNAGSGQRVLSFSLYGSNPDYWRGLEEILSEVEKFYPGWKMRLYTNPRHYAAILCPLLHNHSSLLYICDVTSLPHPLGDLSNVHPMMWRVAPLGDSQVAAMLVRDTDSQLSKRELAAVEEWLASGKMFHVMRDNPQHTMPVMGGMWGARWDIDPAFTDKLRTLRNKMIAMSASKGKYGHDQNVLKTVLWPVMAGRVMAHDSYNCRKFKGSSSWPSQRSNYTFVGLPRFRKKYENSSLHVPCPVLCRPPAHRDWIYC